MKMIEGRLPLRDLVRLILLERRLISKARLVRRRLETEYPQILLDDLYASKYVRDPKEQLRRNYRYLPLMKKYRNRRIFEIGVGPGYFFKLIQSLISSQISGIDRDIHGKVVFRELRKELSIFDQVFEHRVEPRQSIPIPKETEVVVAFRTTFNRPWNVEDHKWFLKDCFAQMSGDRTVILGFNRQGYLDNPEVKKFYESVGEQPFADEETLRIVKLNELFGRMDCNYSTSECPESQLA